MSGSVIVTGSSRGIGRAVAEAYAASGSGVVVNGRHTDAVTEVVGYIQRSGGRATGVVGSVADPEVAAELVTAAEASYGPVEVLVTCAGTAEPAGSSILSVSVAEWRDLVDAHLTATFLACRAVAPGMVARGRGAIVTTTSHAFTGRYGGTGYAAGKGGVNSLTYALAAELREHGIRVNAVAPGARTRLSAGEEFETAVRRLHERGVLDDLGLAGSLDPGPPGHAASLYLFLGSAAAAGVTGQVFAAAGGYLGRFAGPQEELLAWRDHHTHPPYTVEEVAAALDLADGGTA